MIYLTNEALYELIKEICHKHNVNTEYFYKKIIGYKPMPITKEALIELLDEMLVDSFWNDYDNMYKDMSYPQYAARSKKSHEKILLN